MFWKWGSLNWMKTDSDGLSWKLVESGTYVHACQSLKCCLPPITASLHNVLHWSLWVCALWDPIRAFREAEYHSDCASQMCYSSRGVSPRCKKKSMIRCSKNWSRMNEFEDVCACTCQPACPLVSYKSAPWLFAVVPFGCLAGCPSASSISALFVVFSYWFKAGSLTLQLICIFDCLGANPL